MLVPGSLDVLEGLAARGVRVYLASGTDERYVREEAALLGVDRFFGEEIHGAVDDFRSFSKQMVISRILERDQVDPSRLVGFGDGYVEIDNVNPRSSHADPTRGNLKGVFRVHGLASVIALIEPDAFAASQVYRGDDFHAPYVLETVVCSTKLRYIPSPANPLFSG